MITSSYLNLPDRFYSKVAPTPVAEPRLIKINRALGEELDLDLGSSDDGALADLFSGNRPPPASIPIAMAYAGHQFGHFVPQLGDGRAILLGEARDRRGLPRDVQLKGCGRTPYSRGGDGRAALGPVLREYLVSEAMHALGIPATRALAAVASGEFVRREVPLPGAVFTRVAASHVRVGTFEYFAARGDSAAVKLLADYCIERNYPQAAPANNPYLALLREVIDAQASLMARWMHVGFIHGVMNTDNMAVSGETIDFGPCAFMDTYHQAAVFSSIDSQGRYAYGNQPHAAAWNLARFAETLLPLIDANPENAVQIAGEALSAFTTRFKNFWLEGSRRKLGLSMKQDADQALAEDLLRAMQRNEADFTLTFRRLCDAAEDASHDAQVRELFGDAGEYDSWALRWRARSALEDQHPTARAAAMRRVNPAYIPRNHRIEQAIAAAIERQDFALFEDLANVLSQPYIERTAFERFADAPLPSERVLQTFCGT
ncbi:MAG TPA: YdiU family protein [Steroidobacteraceae bacterium]